MAKKNVFNGEILHFGSVRVRVKGSGNLKLTLNSLDDISSDILAPIAMSAATNIEPLQLANLTEQRASLELRTSVIGETFAISRITIFIKQVATGYPQ